MSSMALNQIADIDILITQEIVDKYGTDYVVDKVDTSKLRVCQKSITYKSEEDWWITKKVDCDYLDNNTKIPERYPYHFSNCNPSSASWSIIKAFSSKKYLPMEFFLEYPVSREECAPLKVTFDVSDLGEQFRKITKDVYIMKFDADVSIKPFTTVQISSNVQSCVLKNVQFMSEIFLMGQLKIEGHKKGRSFSKHDITVDIMDALKNKEYLGFMATEINIEGKIPTRCTSFIIEGICSGNVPVKGFVDVTEVTSLV